MKLIDQIKERILQHVSGTPAGRIRPRDLDRSVSRETEASTAQVKQALNELMREEKLVFTYRDPCSYVEFPAVESPVVS